MDNAQIQKSHGQTHTHTESDFLGFLSKPKIAKRKSLKTKIKQILFASLTLHFIKESIDIFNHWYTLKSSPSLQTH